MVSSSFHFIPGIPVLHSKDLLNWTIISHAYDRLENFWSQQDWMWSGYGAGSWAPTIRYHNGKFWIMVGMPTFNSIFITTATNPAGPWSPLQKIYTGNYWQDPAPFWDDDGKAYIVSAKFGCGELYLWQVSPDLTTSITTPAQIASGNCIEGPKLHKRNGAYIIWAPEGGIYEGKEVVLKSNSLTGPYEKRTVFENSSDGTAPGGHQGAWVETQTGESWFIHYQMKDAFGRIVLMQPVTWNADGWPMVGVDKNNNGIGEPVAAFRSPDVGNKPSKLVHQSSDEFDSTQLGLQWQWNFNPVPNKWSLSERPGYLRLKSMRSDVLSHLQSVLTQNIYGMNTSATVKIDTRSILANQIAGLGIIGEPEAWIAIINENNQKKVRMKYDNNWRGGTGSYDSTTINQDYIFLQVRTDTNQKANFFYSLNGTDFTQLGQSFSMYFGYWKGMKYALFSMAVSDSSINSPADFDYFHYQHDGPVASTISIAPSPTHALKEGDANGDGLVNGIDYITWMNHYGLTTTLGNSEGDFNHDTIVNGIDYVRWLNNYGK